MSKINVGGCNCFDCNNGRTQDRSWWKRIWKKEIDEELKFINERKIFQSKGRQ